MVKRSAEGRHLDQVVVLVLVLVELPQDTLLASEEGPHNKEVGSVLVA